MFDCFAACVCVCVCRCEALAKRVQKERAEAEIAREQCMRVQSNMVHRTEVLEQQLQENIEQEQQLSKVCLDRGVCIVIPQNYAVDP